MNKKTIISLKNVLGLAQQRLEQFDTWDRIHSKSDKVVGAKSIKDIKDYLVKEKQQ